MSRERPRIAPSILSADFSRLKQEVEAVERAGADCIHVDVMDGRFVPNLTLGPVIVEPERYIDEFVRSGAATIGVHVETCPHLFRTVAQIREAGAQASVVLNPSTPAAHVELVLPEVDQVLVMTINPGFGGQQFIPAMLPKIRQLRHWIDERGLAVRLEVDGGIAPGTVAQAASAGADLFVAGTAVFRTKDYAAAIAELRREASEAKSDS